MLILHGAEQGAEVNIIGTIGVDDNLWTPVRGNPGERSMTSETKRSKEQGQK